MGQTSGRHPGPEEGAAPADAGQSTASQVVNDSPRVSDRSREAVRKAIAELGGLPRRAVRTPPLDRIHAIALIVPETQTRLFSEPYFSSIIRGAEAELSETDMQLLLILVRTERERTRLARFLETFRVDGALLVSVRGDDTLPEMLERLEIPAILGGRRSESETLSCVHVENFGGARSAVGHLFSRGCRTVATITGPVDQEGARARLEGYRCALEETGLSCQEDLVGIGDFSEESGAAAMTALLDRRPDLDGIFVASDVMAMGALRVLRDAGRSVPDDVAVVGWDDSEMARDTDPPLTTVRQPTEEMGRTMARLLLSEIADPGRSRRQIALGTELVRRRSA